MPTMFTVVFHIVDQILVDLRMLFYSYLKRLFGSVSTNHNGSDINDAMT